MKIKKSTIKSAAKAMTALLFATSLATPAFAQTGPLDNGVELCGVPVCDVQATMEVLASMNQNQRYNYANKLKNEYADSSDIAVLKNLVETGKKLKELSMKLQDEDWVAREASTLANNAILNLAKHSKVEEKVLTELYAQLDSSAKRYEVIEYWRSEVVKMESVTSLSEVVKFAQAASTHSAAIGDEAWISRAADSLAAEATARMVALEPAHEGVYEVKVVSGDPSMLGFDKIVVLDSSSDKNIAVHFINSKLKETVLAYSNGQIAGDVISGKEISSSGMSSSFELSFNRSSAAVTGVVKTTRTKEVVFEGKRVFTTQEVLSGKTPYELSELDVIGTMRGELMGVKGSLSIQSFSENVYSASFVADRGELVLDFQGKFFPKKGALSLTHDNKVKLVLALRKTGDGAVWRGVTFSTANGAVGEAFFAPIHDLD